MEKLLVNIKYYLIKLYKIILNVSVIVYDAIN
jgi:hypothetical protein